MGIFGHRKSRGSIVGNYNTITQTPQKRSKIQDEFDTFGGAQYKGDLMKEHEDNFTTTTTTVTKTEYIDTETGKVMRTTTTTKKKSSSRAGSMVSNNNNFNRADSISGANKPVDNRRNSITNKKKYRYVSSSTGLKMVEITPEDEKLEKERQEKLIRRSNSNVALRPNSMYTPQKRQSSISGQNRQSSLNSDITNSTRKNWAKIERASSGLAAAQIVTGNKEIKKLTNKDLKQRKSMLNMKSSINSPNKISTQILDQGDIKEESPIVESKPVWNANVNANKSIKRVPSMRNGLVINKTPVKQNGTGKTAIVEPSNSLTKGVKKDIKITPMKVKVKPSLSNLKEKDENFLKFQEQAEKKEDVKPVAISTVEPVSKEKTEEDVTIPEASSSEKTTEETPTTSASNTEVPTLKKEDVVPQQEILEEATPEIVPEVNIPVHKEADIVEPLDENSKEIVAEIADTSFSYDQPPFIELDKSDDYNTTPSKKLKDNLKNFESSESVFYSANEDNEADDVILEPIINKEKPLKSAIRTKSKYSGTNENPINKKKVTNEAYVKLTTAENTRLNSQLQDENQRKSRIVRSPSKRVSLKINAPTGQQPSALSKGSLRASNVNPNGNTLKKGKMKMSERMNNPVPMTSNRIRIKPNMNVQLEEPELTPLERRSSFERERGEKKMGFGMMSMRHDIEEQAQGPEHQHSSLNSVPNFKSRFVDSDDEEEYKPKVVVPKKNGTRMMVDAKSSKTIKQEKKNAKPEEKKGLGSKLKKMFSKSKK